MLPFFPSALLIILAFASHCTFSRRRKPGRIAALCLALVAMVCGAWNAGQAQQSLQALHKHVRPAVSSGQAALVSSLPATQRMNLSIVLPLRNQTELTSLLGRLYDPSSPDYHQFLSVEQFAEQFGPTAEDYQAVVDFAQANGFSVTGTSANRLLVPINGTVDQIQKAFHVRMNNYQHPTEKRTFYSPDHEPSLNLSVPVAHIAGLNNYSIPHSMAMKAPQRQSTPAVTGSGPGGQYLSSDMRAAYYGTTALNGSGQCVGLFQLGGYDICHVTSSFGPGNGSYVPATSSSCVNGYSLDGTNYDLAYTPTAGGTTYTIPINNVLLDGGLPEPNGVDAEETLDIVQAIGMAPGLSQVRVYIGEGDASIFNAMASETNPANLCKQLSVSWLWSPDDPATDDVYFQEFAAQGQNVFTASGDSGGYDAAISPVFYPAEDAYVTAVGGTSLLTNGAGGAWESPETAWNTPGNAGSGGGISPDGISIPSWQSEPEVASASNGGSKLYRNVPDVAMEGDTDNYLCTSAPYGCSGGWGGTSFAAPRWAGFMALVNQQAVVAGTAPKDGLGFINPAIYTIGGGSDYDSDFHDITSGNDDCCGQPASDTYTAVPGYDLVTGWGSPNGQSLINALAGPLTTPVMTLSASPDNLTTYLGASGTSTIVINDLGGFTGGVTLTVSGIPSGVTPSGCAGLITTSCVLTLAVSNQAIPGNYLLTITGVSGSKNATTPLALTIDLPSFFIIPSSTAVVVTPTAPGTNTVTVTYLGSFTGNVTLSATGLPNGMNAQFNPNPVKSSTENSSVLTLTSNDATATGTSTVTITGTSGNQTASVNFSLTVNPATSNPLVGSAPSVIFPPVNIGASATMPVVFTFSQATTLGSVSILTQGKANLDYTNAVTGTCAANTGYTANQTCTVNVTFTPKFAGTRYGAAVLDDSSGNVLAIGYLQGTGVGPQMNFLPWTQSVVASGNCGYCLFAITADESGDVYVVDDGHAVIRKETPTAGGYTETTVPTSALNYADGIAVDGAGNVYISDGNNARVLKETPTAGGYSESIVTSAASYAPPYVPGSYEPPGPSAVAVDGKGNVYIALGNGISDNTTWLPGWLIVETPSAGGYTETVIPTPGVNEISGIAVDGSGNVYISEDDGGNGITWPNPKIRILEETLSAGSYTQSIIPTRTLAQPTSIAVDANGNIYITDELNNIVLKETLSAGSYTESTLSAQWPYSVAVDGSGNIYTMEFSDGLVLKEDFADPPSLSFAATPIGSTSSDSPQTVTVENIGNAAMNYPIPSTGNNPSITANFTWNSSGTSACPLVTSGSSTPGTLAAGASCLLPISFTPASAGALSGSLVLTDNNLNAAAPDYATQSIKLSGTGTGEVTPAIVLVSSANPAFMSNSVTFTATISSSAGTPTGTVSFNDGTTLLGTGTLSAGVATCTTSAMAAGSHSITAVYSGDTHFLPVTSGAMAEMVEDFTFAPASGGGSQTVEPGGVAVYTLAVDPPSGMTFPGAINLNVTGLPAGTTAVFSPASVAAGSGDTNVTLTVTVPGVAAAQPLYRPFGGGLLPMALGLIALPFAGSLRRAGRRWKGMVCLLVLGLAGAALAAGLAGCGGGSSGGGGGGGGPQSYTLTVTATSGSLSHSATVNLTVE